MEIDDKLLSNLEKLSNLTIRDEKRQEVENQLSEILGFVENLSELNTDNVSATFSTAEANTTLRDDTPVKHPSASQDILKHAPNSDGTFFIVPKIIE